MRVLCIWVCSLILLFNVCIMSAAIGGGHVDKLGWLPVIAVVLALGTGFNIAIEVKSK